jgi:hypothetical protein
MAMKTEPKFKVGDYVQRVNQPELAGIVREQRWDAQVESWNYLVQFGAQLRAVPEESLEAVTVFQSPWESLEQGSLSGKAHFVFTLTYERLKSPPCTYSAFICDCEDSVLSASVQATVEVP